MLRVLGRSRSLGPMCHLYSDGSHMLQRDRSQRENKKLSEKARSLDASPTPGSKRQRKCSQLCSARTPCFSNACFGFSFCVPTATQLCPGRGPGGAGRGAAFHPVQAPYLTAEGDTLRIGDSPRAPLRSDCLNHYCPKQQKNNTIWQQLIAAIRY